MKLDTKSDGCQQYICQCKPADECEKVDMSKPIEEGIVKEVDESGCCPIVNLVCKTELCSPAPTCPTYYELQNTTAIGKCCPIYNCKAPEKCIFDSEYTASETGGERARNKYEKQKLLKSVCLGDNLFCIKIKLNFYRQTKLGMMDLVVNVNALEIKQMDITAFVVFKIVLFLKIPQKLKNTS